VGGAYLDVVTIRVTDKDLLDNASTIVGDHGDVGLVLDRWIHLI
jgi:hypothetical protein